MQHYYGVMRHYFPDLAFEVVSLHHADGAVVCEMWMSGTHLGLGHRLRGHGQAVPLPQRVIFLFDDERLVGARVYYDTGTIARQLA